MQNPFDPGYYCSEELRGFGFAHVGENAQIAKNCTIIGLEHISIGDHVRIDGFTALIAANGWIELGNRVHIHSYCQIGARGGVTFDDFSNLASGCLVYTASDDISGRHMVGGVVPSSCTKPKVAPVHFKRHATAFARCTILPGVCMEEGAVACAHSLVSQTVPEWTIVAGAPAEHRIARSRRLLSLEALIEEVGQIAA